LRFDAAADGLMLWTCVCAEDG